MSENKVIFYLKLAEGPGVATRGKKNFEKKNVRKKKFEKKFDFFSQ